MLRRLLPLFLLAAGIAGVLAFNTSQREHDYQRLIVEGERALARGNLSAALEAFSGAVTLKPDAMLAYLRRGEAYRRRGLADLGPALRDFREAGRLDASAPAPQEGLGDVYAAREDWTRAIDRYRAALALDDRAAGVQYKLGLALYRAGQPEEALRALTLAASLDPTQAEVPYVRGLCLMELRRTAEAYRAFHDALRLAPAHILAREELANLCREIGRPEEELAHLLALTEAEPNRLERPLALGRAFARSGHIEQAIAALGRAAARYDHEPRIYDAIAQVWLEHALVTGDRVAFEKGLEASRRAAQAGRPADSTLLTLTGSAWLRFHQPRRALRTFEQAVQTTPVDATAYPRLADTAEQMGLWTVARDALRHAHALALDSPSGPTARARMLRIGDLSMKIGDPEAARDWFLLARQGATDSTAALRLAAAEQAIAKERPLFPAVKDAR